MPAFRRGVEGHPALVVDTTEATQQARGAHELGRLAPFESDVVEGEVAAQEVVVGSPTPAQGGRVQTDDGVWAEVKVAAFRRREVELRAPGHQGPVSADRGGGRVPVSVHPVTGEAGHHALFERHGFRVRTRQNPPAELQHAAVPDKETVKDDAGVGEVHKPVPADDEVVFETEAVRPEPARVDKVGRHEGRHPFGVVFELVRVPVTVF